MEYKRVKVIVDKELEFMICTGCGVIVFDGHAHNEWHESLGKTTKQALHADMMTRPIGPGHVVPSDENIQKQVDRLFNQ